MTHPKIVIIILSLMCISTSSAETKNDIWDRAIFKQPFDTTPLHRIKPPDWLNDITCLTYCFSVMDQNSRQSAADIGAQMSEMGFVDPFFVHYDSEFLHQHPPGYNPEKIKEEIANYKRMGVRIIAVYPPGLQSEIYSANPQWRQISTNTTEIPNTDMELYPFGGPLCLMGPYGDYMIDILAEILTKYPEIDAFSFDGLHHGGGCYCQHCRENYRKDAGKEIPPSSMDDPEYREYLYWANRKLENLIERMQTRLKSIKPDVALVTWTTNAGRWGHLLSIPRNMSARMNLLLDAPDQEFWMDESNQGNTIIPAFSNAYMYSVSDHRIAFSSPYLFSHGNPYGADSFPREEVLGRFMLALTWGCRTSIPLAQPEYMVKSVHEGLVEIKKRSPWTTHVQPEPWAAIVMSDNTKTFYGRYPGEVEKRYLSNVFGAFRAAVEEHIPVTIINDWNLNTEDLSRYKVLILPNTACMDENQVDAVRNFVAEGGGLIASMDTSLFDEFGQARENFALSDVFGADYVGIPSKTTAENEQLDVNFLKGIGENYWNKRENIFDFVKSDSNSFSSQKLTGFLKDRIVFKGQAIVVNPHENASVTAIIRKRIAAPTDIPAIIECNFGEGKIAYLPAGLDSAYYLYSYPYQRLVLTELFNKVSKDECTIKVTAPMCVQSTFFRQNKNGQRLVVHLYNDLVSTSRHAKPEDDVPLREEFVPIHNIKVQFTDYNILRIHLEPQGQELEIIKSSNYVQVLIPSLEIHNMIVAELRE